MAYTIDVGRTFWYEFDKNTKYDNKFMAIAGKAGAGQIQTVFNTSRSTGNYPQQFSQFIAGRQTQWQVLADAQTQIIGKHLGHDWNDIRAAFEDFGQGTINDTHPERVANNDRIHTMDVQGAGPPIGYHRWHASIRAIQLLGIGDVAWWERLDELVGLAWGIQSFARPTQQMAPNPSIAQGDLTDLRNAWLGLAPDRRDRQYDLTGDVGYHPTPKQPSQ